ncbi:N-methyl-L-tryptophan oxidase [Frigoriglobus tundricola]|uniref:Sarcosine oxidase n=1 Tax=Frigoriglobus tundricola TaxID=2774151 RepID=A0A6M5YPB3_9BACT|nr:N-methyl-L-tryptophan oxidase [Frigoriglobus tundricola]QJW95123.1 Sarcosine oxidase [Frigoriglobus tundricola]
MAASFDVIVLGVGGMGSAACFELARRGRRVLGLEQFPLVHARGSSHGHTRIIRTAYAEHPCYVPLVRRAFGRWYELEQLTGRHLLTECACLNVGTPGSEHVEGVRASVREHVLAAEELSGDAINRRYPAFRFPADYTGVLEQAAGFLYVEECVRAHIDAATALGAEVRAEEAVRAWRAVGADVEVTTDGGTYRAAKLVVTAGAWAAKLLADIGAPLRVMRQTLHWFGGGDFMRAGRRDHFPIFIADVPGGPFYGLPAIDPSGLKVARHYNAPELPGPDDVDWISTAADAAPVAQFLTKYTSLPSLVETRAQVCMYTVTPDHHFVIDVHPRWAQVSVACGFSGHGFKFASAVGEIMADLAESGRTKHDIEMFGATRFRAHGRHAPAGGTDAL